MERAEGKITPASKSGQLLEKIGHLNLLVRDVLLKSDLDNEGIMDFVLRLISLTKELSRSLSQQLENIMESIQDTCHLLSVLHDKHKELTASPEYNGIIDCLQKVKDYLMNTVLHLQETENKLYVSSCRQDDDSQFQPAQNASRETDVRCSEGKATESVQASSSPSQQSQRTPSLNKTESQNVNKNHLSETKTVEKDIVASLAENVSSIEQDVSREPPMKKEDGEHTLLMNSVTGKKDCNAKDKPHGGSSVAGKSPELAFEDTLMSREEGILSGTSKDIYDGTVMNLSEKEKKAVIKEPSEGVESEEHRLTERTEDSKMETNNEICKNDLITFTSSAQTNNLTAVNLFMNESEKVQKSRHWMNKEFLVEESGKNEKEVACFIKAPATALENLKCKIVNDTSSLVVDDSEELVSNVISIECSDYKKTIPFPINIAIPFTSCCRGNYREIMVKVTDVNFQSNYLTPISLEGNQGNCKENFAEVQIYQLGVFSVLSCLKREIFTVPKAGLSQKLNVDSRISFYYRPETFSSPAPMQLKVQPIEPSLVSTLKARHDTYHAVVATSALVYVQHPSAQTFNSSVTVTLPCFPNPVKKRQGDETEHVRAISATAKRVALAYQPRAVSASVRKNGENLSDTLKLVGHRNKEEGWKVFDNVIIQNVRNGLVSFELNEHLESFVVIRLSFLLENTHLLLFAQALEEAVCSTMANVILYRIFKRENPYKIVVLLSASKELTWEIQNLHEEGYFGPPEPTQHFSLREGEQVHFRFRGNIFASENGKDFGKVYRLIFHSQRKARLELQIKEVDEFGNYSSPHYKGTAVFYKITREMITKEWEQTLPYAEYQPHSPLCKLALTLPKVRVTDGAVLLQQQCTNTLIISLSRWDESSSKRALWDNLLYWLAEELAEDNTSLPALCLPVRRSVLQLVRLKCPDNLTHQIYELLCCWKKTLPRSADKQQLLSRYLRKSGRSDLSEELRFKWQNKMFI
ncbi:PREDICTED: LOW QUALITY PROTEIN: death domain-containing protein 1 [Pterocles gutturalis]|uniref:LOW QUALITY PROTEIN: death domain-containing protein 1 n=1 Tax=Pterocles gutturalis TaxID=240206 RepID=UPI000528AD4D|nr:PREDICTED: LOW QUALITY PROTEIN: death domain-containing protein 1 [Pterocles gutturalis]